MWLSSLRTMKANSGKTTRQIAELSGVPEPTLEKLFSGATREPKLETVRAVVQALGYTLNDLEPAPGQKEKAQNAVTRSEPLVTVDGLARLLEQAGVIEPGADLTDDDFRFLSSVVASVVSWFGSK